MLTQVQPTALGVSSNNLQVILKYAEKAIREFARPLEVL